MKQIYLILFVLLLVGTSGSFMAFDIVEPSSPNQLTAGGQEVKDKNGKVLQVRYVRKNAHDDAENMQILADALKTMKEMNCKDPMSYYMQVAIHGAFPQSNVFCEGADYTNARNVAWNNCTHDNKRYDQSRMHFYTWHKIYLNHFEEIIRKVSGKPNFALPYWEYDNSEYHKLPEAFMDKTSSLYDAHRIKIMNNGAKFDVHHFSSAYDFTTPGDAYGKGDFNGFTRAVESRPHNKMHVYLGYEPTEKISASLDNTGTDGYGYMYQGYSPMDPIFWVHHANIDRLYEKWLIAKIDAKIDDVVNAGRPLKKDFRDQKWDYRFYNAGEDQLTIYSDLDKVFDMAFGVQTYAYDMFIDDGSYNQKYEKKVNKAIANHKWGSDKLGLAELHISEHDKDIKLGGAASPQFNVLLDVNGFKDARFKKVKIKKAKKEIITLNIDVEFTKVPKGVFSVFIKDKNNKSEHSEKTLAGAMTFFGAGHIHSAGDSSDNEDHDHDGDHLIEMHFEFEVTDKVNLSTSSGDFDFEIIPSNVTDKITIDKIQLVKKVFTK